MIQIVNGDEQHVGLRPPLRRRRNGRGPWLDQQYRGKQRQVYDQN
jgi:hypothetical protein